MAIFLALIIILIFIDLREVEKQRAELDDQNDTLRSALDYFEYLYATDPQEASAWLHDWDHGDEHATNELDLWVERTKR